MRCLTIIFGLLDELVLLDDLLDLLELRFLSLLVLDHEDVGQDEQVEPVLDDKSLLQSFLLLQIDL